MTRSTATHGACIMIGLICGLLLCCQPTPNAPPGPADPACGEHRVEWNGNPENWSPVRGCVDRNGVLSWWPEDQRFDVAPADVDVRELHGEPLSADRWVAVRVNGRAVSMWGWKAGGRSRWRVSDQRTTVLPAGDLPRPSGVKLPSGFEPPKEAKTGALLMGVDPKGLQKDTERIRASDPETKAEAEDLRQFYAMAPDASAKTIARNLPKVISPNTWASVFGYDLKTAGMRIGGAVCLAAAAWILYHRTGACPA